MFIATNVQWRGEFAHRGSSRHCAGFSLIELMVTVLIVGVLAAVAIPSYRSMVLTANRSDAIRTLTQDAQMMERCYSQTFTYQNCTAVTAGPTPNSFYNVTVNVTAANAYVLTATVAGGSKQAADTTCNAFTISNNTGQGATSLSGANTTQTCWSSN